MFIRNFIQGVTLGQLSKWGGLVKIVCIIISLTLTRILSSPQLACVIIFALAVIVYDLAVYLALIDNPV